MLEDIKKEANVAKTFQAAYTAVINVAQGGMVSNVVRVIALLLLGAGWLILRKNLIDRNIERAKQLTAQEQEELKKYLTQISSGSDDVIVTDLENGF
jgi:predicted ATP-grasp superfamily ATP-dependent carboligase